MAYLFWEDPSDGQSELRTSLHQDSTNAFMSVEEEEEEGNNGNTARTSYRQLSTMAIQPTNKSMADSTRHSCLVEMVLDTLQELMRTMPDAENAGSASLNALTTALGVMGCIITALVRLCRSPLKIYHQSYQWGITAGPAQFKEGLAESTADLVGLVQGVYFERHYEIHISTLTQSDVGNTSIMAGNFMQLLYRLTQYRDYLACNRPTTMTKPEHERAFNDATALLEVMQVL